MSHPRVIVPSGQNWSCHGCAKCCSGGMYIPLTPEDIRRLEGLKWPAGEGVPTAQAVVSSLGKSRLGHQPDGKCVFLNAAGRCRIHAQFGEAAKPLACRLFPLVIHPAGKQLVLGLRFSCPSAAGNQGAPLAEQAAGVPKLAAQFLPDHSADLPPPPVVQEAGLTWPDFWRFVHQLDATLATPGVSIALKLIRSLYWLGQVEQGKLDRITDDSADEILAALADSAVSKIPVLPPKAEPSSQFGRVFFRLMVLEYAHAPTLADRDLRSGHRWKMLAAAWRVIRASGKLPQVRPELPPVSIAAIESLAGPLPASAEALLTRYFRVKVQGLQFCGTAFFDRPMLDGFRNLALLYPCIVWLARWHALGAGRRVVDEEDVLRAVAIVDHQYGHTPYLKWRTNLLQQRNDIVRLCAWAAR